MKINYQIIIVLLLLAFQVSAQDPFAKTGVKQEAFELLNLNEIKPLGWLKELMIKDMNGFTGNLDKLVPDLIVNDDIYGKNRLTKEITSKDLGNNPEGADWEVQFLWWNSETQSNWWDGYIRNAFFLDNKQYIEKCEEYVKNILSTQDPDGYIGIYKPDLRYKFGKNFLENGENGELWSKANLYRALLAYYGFTKDKEVLIAVEKAVRNVMDNYKINDSQPFNVNKPSGGLCHGLVFTDVLDQLYRITGNQEFWDYSLFLYQDYSKHKMSEEDIQYLNIINPEYCLKDHGVHTYEHIRPLIVAGYASGNPELEKALKIYLDRVNETTTFTGGPIGDEWIFGRKANPTNTGYEYCSLLELLDSYGQIVMKTGNITYAHIIENIFYNAALGARHPEKSCISYLKTDNSYEMTGGLNGKNYPNHKQTRYKYSPVHKDVAVCCVPNAGRITPYYLQFMWLKDKDGLISLLPGSSEVQTFFNEKSVNIKQQANYPYLNKIQFEIDVPKTTTFALKIRKPLWASGIVLNEKYTEEEGFVIISKDWNGKNVVNIEFKTEIQKHSFENQVYFTYSGLVLALPIAAIEIPKKIYYDDFQDFEYKPEDLIIYQYRNKMPEKNGDFFSIELYNPKTKKVETKNLEPIGNTILRQVTF